MNQLHTLSRRSLLKHAMVGGAAIAGTTAMPPLRHAFAQTGDYELVCNADGVRIRTEPRLSGTILGSVSSGDGVWLTGASVEADGYLWIPVTVMGANLAGWTAAMYFERPDGEKGWFRGTAVHVSSDTVNLRSGAGLNHSIIGNFNTGTNAIVNDGPRETDDYAWYNITIDGLTGWMAADFLAEGTYNGGDPDDGWSIGTDVMPITGLNLRTGPGTGSGVIRVYGAGEAATILDGPQAANGYTWYKVETWSDGRTGWFAGEYLELAKFEPTGARHRIVDGPLNLREYGALSAPVMTTLATGEIVVITDASFGVADGYTWMMVYVEDNPSVRGWIAQGFSSEI